MLVVTDERFIFYPKSPVLFLGDAKLESATKYLIGKVVIKYGTNALTSVDGKGNVLGLDNSRISDIAQIVDTLYSHEVKPILVSSAAVAVGMAKNKLTQRPVSTLELQCLASEGQYTLMSAYEQVLRPYGIGVYQMLVTHANFRTFKELANLKNVVEAALRNRKLPIFNANDTVTNSELVPKKSKYGFTDNDPLSAFVAICLGAYSLLMVSESGMLGSGGGTSKGKALGKAKEAGVATWVGTHAQLKELVAEELN